MSNDRENQLLVEATRAGITSPRELANFMGQMGHESNGLNRLNESFRYTRDIGQIPVRSAMREGAEALEAARVEALRGHPERLGELMYGGRMGNDSPGDGYRYHGRGYTQLTGKDNYEAAGKALNMDLVRHPELASDPANAAKIAVWYWETRVPESAREDVKAATYSINGGYNGLADRRERFADWQQTLTPDVMQRLSHGEVGARAPHVAPAAAEHHGPAHPRAAAHAAPAAMADGSLRKDEHGAAVKDLQTQLRAQGIHDGHGHPLVPDGHYGNRTVEAVRAFQHAHGLQEDGIAGKQTLGKLHELQQAAQHPERAASAQATATPAAHASPVAAAAAGTAALSLASERHPDHALYQSALSKLEGMGSSSGLHSREALENAAGRLTYEAKFSGMTHIDHVVANPGKDALFAVQGNLGDPAMRRVVVDTQNASQQPLQDSSRQMAELAPAPDARTVAPVQEAPQRGMQH